MTTGRETPIASRVAMGVSMFGGGAIDGAGRASGHTPPDGGARPDATEKKEYRQEGLPATAGRLTAQMRKKERD